MEKIFKSLESISVLGHHSLLNLARIHFLLDLNPQYKTKDVLQRLDLVFTSNSLSESTSLYLLRDGTNDFTMDHYKKFDHIINTYRNAQKMRVMLYRETLATRDLAMFLPIYKKSLLICGEKEAKPKEKVFMFLNDDLISMGDKK